MKIVKKTLDELGYVRRGKSKHRPRDAAHLYDGPYPFIQTSDVKNAGLYITEYTQTYSAAGLAQSKLWKAGTLCITIAANIGDTAILSFDACFPDSIVGFIPDSQEADARYIKYLFGTVMQQRFKKFTQGATQDNLSQEKLLSLKLPVADDVGDQKKIADRIAVYDALINVNRRRIQFLEEVARFLYREWFVYFRFPGHEKVKLVDHEGMDMPEGWNREKLNKYVTFKRGVEPGSDNYLESQEDDTFPFCRVSDLVTRNPKIFVDELHTRGALLEKKDIVVSLDGSVGIVSMGLDGCYSTGIRKLIIKGKRINRSFLYCLMKSHYIQGVINAYSKGTTIQHAGESVKHINPLLPPQNLMNTFGEIIEPAINEVLTLLDQNQKLVQARDLLLPRLMSGAIEVSEFDIRVPQEAET